MTQEHLEVDLLVIGGGMAGMTAASYAARRGAAVMLVEKADQVGGSAALSGGGLVAPASLDVLREVNPSGDPRLAEVLISNYEELVRHIHSLGVQLTPPPDSQPVSAEDILGIDTIARAFDVLTYMERGSAVIAANGGWVAAGAHVERLVTEDGAVVGAVVSDREGEATVRAPWTLLATGGFQNNRELMARHIHENATNVFIRSNKVSAGDGLRLGLSVGAAMTENMDRFYGHTMPWPLHREIEPRDYIRHAQFYLTPRCILLDADGRRFIDESLGYYVNSQAVLRQPQGRALLVGDQQVRDEDGGGGGIRGAVGVERLDRLEEARREGANAAEAPTLQALEQAVAEWGYHNLEKAVSEYNERVEHDHASLQPGRTRHRRTLPNPPFWAMEVQSAITFTFGGLRINEDAQVLNEAGTPIPGLLAAGADAGGMYHEAYCGGLGMSGTVALQAARMATSKRSA